MLGSLPPPIYASLGTLVGIPRPVHAVYMLCAGSVHVDGLLGTVVLSGGLYLRGSFLRNCQKEEKREVSARYRLFHRGLWLVLASFAPFAPFWSLKATARLPGPGG